MEQRKTFGILIGNANSPHTMKLIEGIQDAAKRINVNLVAMVNIQSDAIFSETQAEDKELNNPVFDMVDYTGMDGIIFSYGTMVNYVSREACDALIARIQRYPHVILESEKIGMDATTIVSDNYHGIQSVTEHLITEHGKKNLTFISGPEGNEDSEVRKKAFFDTLREYGLPSEADRSVTGDFTPWVEAQINTLLGRYPDLDAIVCANDQMAITTEKVLKKRGLSVGKDIAVTGYDDREICSFSQPPLTSVTQSSYQMGFESVMALERLLSGKPAERIRIPAEPVFRVSCGCSGENCGKGDPGSLVISFEEQIYNYRQQSWMVSHMARHMMKYINSDTGFFEAALSRFKALGCGRSFLFLFDTKEEEKQVRLTDRLYLAAEQTDERVLSYFGAPKTYLNRERGLSEMVSDQEGYRLCVFNLTSGDIRYGFLVLKIRADQIALFYTVSLEIANTIRFYYLTKAQKRILQDMEKLLAELDHKNQIMSFVSEYDALTGARNRRGFMEQVLSFAADNPGKEVVLLYADLDHLKGINDIFGHKEGDFALIRAAQDLKETLPKGSVIGRIGGDEFVALFGAQKGADPEEIIRKIRERQAQFNEISKKEYYIEMSMGYTRLICMPQLSVATYLDLADQQLYSAKKHRRKNVCKAEQKQVCGGGEI